MPQITKPAVNIRQGKRVLYLTSFTAAEFAAPKFFDVKELDPATEDGYQRILDATRSKRVASGLMALRNANEAFLPLPTAAFLATEAAIDYNPETREISFDTDKTGPLNVVDGQHRIRGLIKAYEDMPSLADFPLATVIAPELDKLHQKLHFFLVNTTQKPVDESVQQRIKAKLQEKRKMGERIVLPQWLAKKVDKDSLTVAQDITDFLSGELPWHGRILMANTKGKSGKTTTKEATFRRTIEKYILADGHLLYQGGMREDQRNDMLKNYWLAVADVFAGSDADKSVVFGSTGVYFFHSVSRQMFNWLAVSGDYTVSRIKECFRLAIECLPESDLRLSRADWWRKGGGVSGWNTTQALDTANEVMAVAIYQASQKEQGGDDL